MRVAVLRGGRSSEHDVSLRSGESVLAGLREAGHEAIDVRISRDGAWLLDGEEVELRAGGGLEGCDVVFPVLHGPFGEDGTLQGVLETLDVPYVGATVLASAVCMDKITFKRVLAERGMPQVGFCSASDPNWRGAAERLGLPLWVKPSRLGSSVGIVKVDSLEALDEAVEAARSHDPRVIVEAHADGREIECSVTGNGRPDVSVCGEISFSADWYDYEAKYEAGGMELTAPAELDEAVSERIRTIAAEVYLTVGCTGLARCDFFLRGDDVLVNEVNTLPGFTETSVFARLFEASGVSYPKLVDRLLGLAVERHEADRGHTY